MNKPPIAKVRVRFIAVPVIVFLGGAVLLWKISSDDFGVVPSPPSSAPAAKKPRARSVDPRGIAENEKHTAIEPRSAGAAPKSMELKAVLMRVDQLIAEGEFPEALEECLDCYARSRRERPGSPDGQLLMNRLAKLGRRYPPAVAALRELRDTGMRDLTANPTSGGFTLEVAMLNQRLGDDERTVALLDSIPKGGPQHQMVAMTLYPILVEKGRYADALIGKPFGQMIGRVDAATDRAQFLHDQQLADFKKHFVQEIAQDIEVLIGAGRDGDAQVLAERFFQFDSSEETRQLLMKRIRRIDSPKS